MTPYLGMLHAGTFSSVCYLYKDIGLYVICKDVCTCVCDAVYVYMCSSVRDVSCMMYVHVFRL